MSKRMEGKEKSPSLEKTVVWKHCLPVDAYRKLGPWRTQHSLRASETEKSSSPTLTDATKTSVLYHLRTGSQAREVLLVGSVAYHVGFLQWFPLLL